MKYLAKKLLLTVLAVVTFVATAVGQTNWYSYRAVGAWSSTDTWTLSSGGTQFEQRDPEEVPGIADNVTITANKIITIGVDESITVRSVNVVGSLILSQGATLNLSVAPTGNGNIQVSSLDQIKVNGVSLKTFSGTISFAPTSSDVTLEGENAFGGLKVLSGKVIVKNELHISGNVDVEGGVLTFFDPQEAQTSENSNKLIVDGNMTVAQGALFTGEGANDHTVVVKGNFTNNGMIGIAPISSSTIESQINTSALEVQARTNIAGIVGTAPTAPNPAAYYTVADDPGLEPEKEADPGPTDPTDEKPTLRTKPTLAAPTSETLTFTKSRDNKTYTLASCSVYQGELQIQYNNSSKNNDYSISATVDGTDIKLPITSIPKKGSGTITAEISGLSGTISIKVGSANVTLSSLKIVNYISQLDYVQFVDDSNNWNEEEAAYKVDYPIWEAKMEAYKAWLEVKETHDAWVTANERWTAYQTGKDLYDLAYAAYEQDLAQYNANYQLKYDEEYAHLYNAEMQRLYNAAAAAQMNTLTSRLLTIQFEGSNDAKFNNNSSAKVNRIRAMKSGVNTNIIITNTSVLNTVASTDAVMDYKDLPWSVSSGVLTLGEGVNINSWGVPSAVVKSGIGGYFNKSTDHPQYGYPMYIPSGATLVIAGANINVGKSGHDREETTKSGAVVIAGKLQMKNGTLTLPDYSPGILLANTNIFEATTSTSKPSLTIEGGVINTTVIASHNHQASTLTVSNGTVNYNAVTIPDYPYAALTLSKGSLFTMSGGVFNFTSKVKANTGCQAVNGIWLSDYSKSGDTSFPKIDFSVTGGTINIIGIDDFRIFGNGLQLYDVNITNKAYVVFNNLQSGNPQYADNSIRIHNMSISGVDAENKSVLDVANGRVYISGNVNIGQFVDITVPDGVIPEINGRRDVENQRDLVFAGSDNATYSDDSDVQWKNVVFEKGSNATLTVVTNKSLKVKGNYTANYGNLIGTLELKGAGKQYITDKSKGGMKGAVLKVNNTANGIELASDAYFKTVEFARNNRFYLAEYNLKVDEYPTCPGLTWSENNMFYTNNSQAARGITVPVPRGTANKTVHIGTYAEDTWFYSSVTPKYTGEAGKYIRVVSLYGIHPQLDESSDFKFYWRIESDVEVTSGDGVYDCYVVNKDKKVYSVTSLENAVMRQPMVILSGGSHQVGDKRFLVKTLGIFPTLNSLSEYTINFKKDVCEADRNCSNRGKFYTSGDFVMTENSLLFSDLGDNSGKNFVAVEDGLEWIAFIWEREDEPGSRYSGNDITEKDNIKIPDGVTVYKCENPNVHIKGAKLVIEKGGKFVVDQSCFNMVTISSIQGTGTMQYNLNSRWSGGALGIPSDFSSFCNSTESTMVFNLTGDMSQYPWPYQYMPNVVVLSDGGTAREFRWLPESSSTIDIKGNLELGTGVTFSCYGYDKEKINIDGIVTVGDRAKFDVGGNSTRYYIREDIINNGSIINSSQEASSMPEFFITHSKEGGNKIQNKGTIDLSSSKVVLDGDETTTVEGSAATAYGRTNLGQIYLRKSTGDKGIYAKSPICNAAGECILYMESGTFWHQFNNKSADPIVYKGDANFNIPAGGRFSANNANMVFYIDPSDPIDCNRVKLGGQMDLTSSVLKVGKNDGSGFEFGGIGYISGSVLNTTSSTVETSFLAPFSGAPSISLTSANTKWYFRQSDYKSENYGIFDIREGSSVTLTSTTPTTTSTTVALHFYNVPAESTVNPTIYYHPVTSTFTSMIFIRTGENDECLVDASSPLAYVRLKDNSVGRIVNNPLFVTYLAMDAGSVFHCGDYDLTLSNNLLVNKVGGFTVGKNTVKFISETTALQEIRSASSIQIDFYNLLCRTQMLQSTQNPIIVAGEFRVEAGTYYTNKTAKCMGDVYIARGSAVTGEGGMHMISSAPQKLRNEGIINKLTIENDGSYVDASEDQTYPCTIESQLVLKKGSLKIGRNMLELSSSATISKGSKSDADFGADKMIITNSSFTDRGVRLNFASGVSKSMVVPIGSVGKYSPVELIDVMPATTGYLNIIGNNGVHSSIALDVDKSKYLKYYWSLNTDNGMTFTSGDIQFTDVISDAVGYDVNNNYTLTDGPYMSVFLNDRTGLFNKYSNTKDYTYIGHDAKKNNIVIKFALSGSEVSGIYTAGCENHIPNNVETWVSTVDGPWNGAIWQKYDLVGNAVIEGTPQYVPNKKGRGFVINSNVYMTENKQNVYFLRVDAGSKIDFRETYAHNMGNISGQGTITLHSGDFPGGYLEKFFDVNGGTVEYAGDNKDYRIFVSSAYHNNVILSGSGTRTMPDNDIAALGNVTYDGNVNVVMSGYDFNIGGDLDISNHTGSLSGAGRWIFDGTTAQRVISSSDITVPGIGINNEAGVTISDNLTVRQLLLTKGVITMEGNKVLLLPDAGCTIDSKSDFSWVSGYLARWAVNSVETPFYIGDSGESGGPRNGQVSIIPDRSGIWTLRYYDNKLTNEQETEIISSIAGTQYVGSEYWEVLGPDATAKASTRLRWDSQSGGFEQKTSKVFTYNGANWETVPFTNASNNRTEGTLQTISQVSRVGGTYRIYVLGTCGISTDFIWEGGLNDDWSEAENWENKEVPTIISVVKIRAGRPNNPVIYEGISADVKSLTILDGGNLTLTGNGATLTVANNVEIQHGGNLTLVYDVDANPNFIVKGEIVGDAKNEINVNRSFYGKRIYYIGSATAERTIVQPKPAVEGWGFSNLYLKKYNPADGTFSFPSSPAFPSYGSHSFAESFGTYGYLYDSNSATIDPAATYTTKQIGQVMNSADIANVNVVNGALWYNNPYPYALQLTKNTIKFNAGSQVQPTLYVRGIYTKPDDQGEEVSDWAFETFNLSNGLSTGLVSLAPFQGFHILNPGGNSAFTIKAIPANGGSILKSAEIDNVTGNVIRLFAGTEGKADQLVVLFNEDGEYRQFEGDSKKLGNEVTDYRNIISTNKGADALTIAHFPSVEQLINDRVKIPISVGKATKSYELAIWAANLAEFNYDGDIFIVDNLTGKYINLTQEGKYICPSVDNLYEGRFELTFIDPTVDTNEENATAIESVAGSDRIEITGRKIGKAKVTIFGTVSDNAYAVVYDIMGREISRQAIKSNVSELNIGSNGVIIVKVFNGDVTKSAKLVYNYL